jgi:GAF domain-containing protein
MKQEPVITEYEHTRWRAGFLRVTLIAASVLGLVALVPAVISTPSPYPAIYIGIYLIVLLATILPVHYNLKAAILISLLVALAISGMTETGIMGDGRVFMLGAIAMASLMFSWRAGWVLTGLAAALYAVFGWLILGGTLVISNPTVRGGTVEGWISNSFVVLLLAVLIVNSIRLMQSAYENSEKRSVTLVAELQHERSSLEQRIQERTSSLDRRTSQLRAVADIGKSVSSYRSLTELLRETTFLISRNFGYYHVGIFLLDARREYAVLAAANSDGGLRMLEKKHQLKIGETSIVGYTIANVRARIALDVGQDAVYFDNPDLPQTRSEMALPLVARGQVLGALDIQSTESQAFTEEDVAALQILAEQIAVAIQNANLFSETEKSLERARIISGEVSREAWNRILRSQTRVGFIATPPATVQTEPEYMEPNLTKAFETGDVILSNDGLTIGIPIKIRGQSIGAIRLKKPEIAEAWTQEEINLAITLSDQLSNALESARLYQEAQQRAARESLVSDISAKIGSLVSVENILQTAVQELGNTLPNTDIAIQFTQGTLEQR